MTKFFFDVKFKHCVSLCINSLWVAPLVNGRVFYSNHRTQTRMPILSLPGYNCGKHS